MGVFGKLLRYQRDFGTVYTLRKIFYRYQIKYRAGKKWFPLQISQEERSRQESFRPDKPVRISVVVPLYNTKKEFLCELIESVQNQTYQDWELCLADASDDKREEVSNIVLEYASKDARIHYHTLGQNGGISENTNQAVKMAKGQYIALLDHDDLLHPSALFFVAQEIQQYGADFIYTDELTFDRSVDRIQSIHFKPGFSRESFRTNNYICHFAVFRKSLLAQTGGFRKEFDGSQDYDLMLRLTEVADCIRHVPKVLYYWRSHAGSVASAVGAKPYTVEAGRRALEEHLMRRNIAGTVESLPEYGPFYKIDYQISRDCSVRILPENQNVYDSLQKEIEKLPWRVILERPDAESEGDMADDTEASYVLLVRDGFAPERPAAEWIRELLSCLVPEENKVVSSIVYSTSGKVVHGGYYYGREYENFVQPLYCGVPRKDPAYMNRLACRQNITLMEGAVMACTSDILQEYNRMLAKEGWSWSLFSDMAWFSLCLTSLVRGGDNVLTPYAPFIQQGCKAGKSQNMEKNPRENSTVHKLSPEFVKSWKNILDQGDVHSSPGIKSADPFGRYYFLWK